jgi:hypothetical protein
MVGVGGLGDWMVSEVAELTSGFGVGVGVIRLLGGGVVVSRTAYL